MTEDEETILRRVRVQLAQERRSMWRAECFGLVAGFASLAFAVWAHSLGFPWTFALPETTGFFAFAGLLHVVRVVHTRFINV